MSINNGFLKKYISENFDAPLEEIMLDEELLEEIKNNDEIFFT